MSQHIEMIVDYLVIGDDFQYSDNHGILIRCGDCKSYINGRCYSHDVQSLNDWRKATDYCSFAERRTK